MHCGKAIVTPLVQVRVRYLVLRTSPLPSKGSRGGNRGTGPPYFLDQTEARRAGKYFFRDCPPSSSLFQGLDDRPPPPLPPYLKVCFRQCSLLPFPRISHILSWCQGNRMLPISSVYQSKTNYHILS